jgi:hypothetical protein
MKNGLVIADAGPIFTLAVIDHLELLDKLFEDVKIAPAVWNEISTHQFKPIHTLICTYFESKVQEIAGFNELSFIMDRGESESVMLYKETQADFLLIDDKKARNIAESLGINCVGILGILCIAKEKGLINELRPLFEIFLLQKRFYSLILLNSILLKYGEAEISFNFK